MPLPAVVGDPTSAPVTTIPGGGAGTLAGSSPAQPQGVCIAFDDPWDAANPTWTRIDDPNAVDAVQQWSIQRGRTFELDKTSTGTATLKLFDQLGYFDPTNSTSPYYGRVLPGKQALIALQNPVNGTWTTVFRGFVDDWTYDLDVSEKLFYIQLDLVDAMERISRAEVIPGVNGAAIDPASGVQGDVLYISQPVDDRIKAALIDAGWPTGQWTIFSGNVNVQDTVYSPRAQILSVIQDAADAEFPGVANFFIGKNGNPTFHGRLARFNPGAYGLGAWKCGDLNAFANDSTTAVITRLVFGVPSDRIINAALSTPQNIKDEDVAGQASFDSASLAEYGTRTWSAENLIVRNEQVVGTDANAESKLFGDYYVENYHDPRTRISQVEFKTQDPGVPMGPAVWALMCGIEIGDTITITTTHPGGGGFNLEPYFVEGVNLEAEPMTGSYPLVTCTLDLSPQAYFTNSAGLNSPH